LCICRWSFKSIAHVLLFFVARLTGLPFGALFVFHAPTKFRNILKFKLLF
jgi:hypothetical protein